MPVLENVARASALVVAPTVIACGARAGDALHASAPSLPAATAKLTPSSMPRWTAASSVAEMPPPRLMFATAGAPAAWLATTQSMPLITPVVLPEPLQLSTRTGTRLTPLATP